MENFDEILKQLEDQLEKIKPQEQQEQQQEQQQVQQQEEPQVTEEQANQFYYEVELQRFIAKHPDISNLHQLLPHIVQKAKELSVRDNNRRPFAEYLEQGLFDVVKTLASVTKETLSSLSFTTKPQQPKQSIQPTDPKEALRRFYEEYYDILKKATVKSAYVDARISSNNETRELKGSGLLKLGDKINLN